MKTKLVCYVDINLKQLTTVDGTSCSSDKMDRREIKSRSGRREIRSVCMPVPTIILNPTANTEHALSHSRSAGDLDTVLCDTEDYADSQGKSKFSSSVSDGIQQIDAKQTNGIGLYCSPRMTRRAVKSTDAVSSKQSGAFLESLNACSLNCLDPGSRVGSTVSLNSEYTSRSIGLISNDSNSECSSLHYSVGVMDGSLQKHGVLKRFYSTPEKDAELLHYPTSVRRNSKSMGNMQNEDMESSVCFDFGSDSTNDDNLQGINGLSSCDIERSLEKTSASEEGSSSSNLVTMVTGSSSLREGRIRKWLTEICDPDESSNPK